MPCGLSGTGGRAVPRDGAWRLNSRPLAGVRPARSQLIHTHASALQPTALSDQLLPCPCPCCSYTGEDGFELSIPNDKVRITFSGLGTHQGQQTCGEEKRERERVGAHTHQGSHVWRERARLA